jgi:neprilysin
MKNLDTDSTRVPISSNKKLIFIFLSVTIVLLAAVIVLGTLLGFEKSNKTETSSQTETKICTTKACIKAAHSMLENMNQSADPCEDFNQFACGNFIRTQRIPDDSTNYGSFTILRNTLSNAVSELLEEPISSKDIKSTSNAKILYQSCIDETQVELTGEANFLNFIQSEFGDWPALNGKFNEATFDPMDTLVKFRLYGFRQVVDVRVEVNPKNSSQYVLKARQPTWFLNKDYYNSSIEQSVKVINAYKKYAKTFLTYMNNDKEVGDAIVDGMYDIEKSLGVVS